MTAPRIYVACLASYNAGRLHGRWIDASTDTAAMGAEINAMLRESPYPNVMRATYKCADCGESRVVTESFGKPFPPSIECEHCGDPMPIDGDPYKSAEEYAIHDHEGLGDLSEYAGLDEVARRVALSELADERNIPLAVLLEATRDMMSGDADADDVESWLDDHYRGTAETWADYAESFVRDCHDMSAVPEWLQNHIDWESLGREFEVSGDLSAYRDGPHGDLYLFDAH